MDKVSDSYEAEPGVTLIQDESYRSTTLQVTTAEVSKEGPTSTTLTSETIQVVEVVTGPGEDCTQVGSLSVTASNIQEIDELSSDEAPGSGSLTAVSSNNDVSSMATDIKDAVLEFDRATDELDEADALYEDEDDACPFYVPRAPVNRPIATPGTKPPPHIHNPPKPPKPEPKK